MYVSRLRVDVSCYPGYPQSYRIPYSSFQCPFLPFLPTTQLFARARIPSQPTPTRTSHHVPTLAEPPCPSSQTTHPHPASINRLLPTHRPLRVKSPIWIAPRRNFPRRSSARASWLRFSLRFRYDAARDWTRLGRAEGNARIAATEGAAPRGGVERTERTIGPCAGERNGQGYM